MKHLLLEQEHIKNNARMMEFAGWYMPIQYTGIIDEHLNTRNNTSLFDISHMGIVAIKGPQTIEFLQHLVPNNLDKIYQGKGIYTHLLNNNGEVLDDLIFYWIEDDFFLTVTNAVNTDCDYEWIKKQTTNFDVTIENISDDYCMFALQGPKSEFLAELYPDITDKKMFEFVYQTDMMISRTGYTGDFGYEIILPNTKAKTFFYNLLEKGAKYNIKLAGLGARDSLRIEAGLPLYGHELNKQISLTETNLLWTIDFNKEFIGKTYLLNSKEKPDKKKLIGFVMLDKGVPREKDEIFLPDKSKKIGFVTSGTYSPYLKKFIGIAYILVAELDNMEDNKIIIKQRNKSKKADIVKLPFFKRK